MLLWVLPHEGGHSQVENDVIIDHGCQGYVKRDEDNVPGSVQQPFYSEGRKDGKDAERKAVQGDLKGTQTGPYDKFSQGK